MKKCFKCGIVKPISEFYIHSKMGDGHLNKCKDCTKSDSIKQYNIKVLDSNWKEKERTRGRYKYRRLYVGTGKADQERILRYEKKYPEKAKAHALCSKLKKPFVGAEKHHWSYNEKHFLDIIWLSKKEHMKAHRFIVYDQEEKKYRRFDNNKLLSTRQSHFKFIDKCIKEMED